MQNFSLFAEKAEYVESSPEHQVMGRHRELNEWRRTFIQTA